jgi:hypothetical protein
MKMQDFLKDEVVTWLCIGIFCALVLVLIGAMLVREREGRKKPPMNLPR